MTWADVLLEYAGLALRVVGVTVLVIAAVVWLNWLRLGKPKPPDDFK